MKSSRAATFQAVILFASTALLLSSCATIRQTRTGPDAGATATDTQLSNGANFNDSQAIDAQSQRMSHVEITVRAPVYEVLRPDTEGLPHERFLLRLSNGTTVLVAHDTKMAPTVPLQAGDVPIIHGEYIWNDRGGVIHWTHHTDTPRHEGGWIYLNGVRYQ